MNKSLYSIKMRGASPVDHKLGGKHISGAECIAQEDSIKNEVKNLIDRALTHSRGKSDFINISIQKIDNSNIKYISPLKISNLNEDEHKYINSLLKRLGFSEKKIKKSLETLFNLKNLKGALIISFDDLFEFRENIVRCSNMDYDNSIKDNLNEFLHENNFKGKYLKDALCLSSKICNHENVLCEFCISDDKNYTTGYIASKKYGYVRIKGFKPQNHEYGGRIIFIKNKDYLNETLNYLKESIVLINSIPQIVKIKW